MRIFLTGGTGLIGCKLVAALLERGDEAVVVTRSQNRAAAILPAGVEIIEAHTVLSGAWQNTLARCDGVVNLAGESVAKGRWTESRKKQLRRSRLQTTRNVAEAVAGSERVRALVSASATGYYGDGGSEAIDEKGQPGQDFLARLAHEWEGSARTAESAQTRVVLLRIGIVLASGGGALQEMLLPFKLGLGGPLGSGRQYFPWIHIADLVRSILFALDTPALKGPVNAVAPDPPTQRAFARALGGILRRPVILPTPAFLLRAIFGQKAEMLLASQRVIPRALRSHGFQFDFADLDAALADLLD